MSKLTIDINGYCNQDCTFCYQDLDGSQLSQEEVLSLVRARPEAELIQIGGGEPLLHPEFVEMVREIRSLDKLVHVSTNATRIPAGFLELEEKERVGVQVQVSIHGSTLDLYAQIHGRDAIRRQDMLPLVLQNLDALAGKYSTVLSSAIYAENVHDVHGLIALSEVRHLPHRFNLVFPIGKGREVSRLDALQVDQLRGLLLGEYLRTGGRVESPLVHPNECEALEAGYALPKVRGCPVDCGMKVYISPRGEESSCEFVKIERRIS